MMFLRRSVVFLCLIVYGSLGVLSSVQAFLEVEDISQETGYSTWFVKIPGSKVAAVSIAFRHAGSAFDPPGREGLALAASHIFQYGPKDSTQEEFYRWLREHEVQDFSFAVSMDILYGEFRVLSKSFLPALEKMCEDLLTPLLTQERLTDFRSFYHLGISQQNQHPIYDKSYLAFLQLENAIFFGHPYGKPHEGTDESIQALSLEDIEAYIKENLTQDRLMITVVGGMTKETLLLSLKETFGKFPLHSKIPAPLPPIVDWIDENLFMLKKEDFLQSVIVFSHPCVSLKDKDFPAFNLAQHILGGGSFTSRLWRRVRDQEGLAYVIATQVTSYRAGSVIMGSCHTARESAGEAISLIREEWHNFREKGVTEREVQQAKEYLIGSSPFKMKNTLEVAQTISSFQHLDLPAQYMKQREELLEAVTVEEVNNVIRTFFHPRKLAFLLVGKHDRIVNSEDFLRELIDKEGSFVPEEENSPPSQEKREDNLGIEAIAQEIL